MSQQTEPGAVSRSYQCPWCGFSSQTVGVSCPSCGAALDITAVKTDVGWYELPPIKDMAKLQFGQSFCQIEGAYVPVADMSLDAADHVYFTHHVLLWKDESVRIEAMPLNGAWKRLAAGMPLVMTQASGPGHIAFSQDDPGEIIALPLHQGHSIDVREGIFLVATGNVKYDWFDTRFWYSTEGGAQYPIGRYMDRFTATEQHGFVLLHGAGNSFAQNLQDGQSILIKPTALLFKDPAVEMRVYIEHPGGYNRIWSRRYVWLKLTGPGRIAIQSRYPHWEDPPEPVSRASAGMRVHDW